MALNLRFEISPDVISTEAQLDETLLMNTRTLVYFGLNPVGGALWRAMQTSNDADEVIRQVALETEKTVEELEQVMGAILSGMERSRLLKLTEIGS